VLLSTPQGGKSVYFKSLELVGFKSFAERTVIGFEPGITAIVGPNGCGKSNVSDAIRWVLGEQKAKSLRGQLMEDLIFGGSAQTEPMGMAEVSLTLGAAGKLTDGQHDEITVSRRLFRSGESQYFFNKQSCRLRDIQKLFMDTGLGMHSYSYLQQGNIDLILSSKPEDRRFLFDETAGITKYKAHKKEALRKLESTANNLERINDLLREVKRQIISIQRQAGKARRYKDFADELQQLDVGFLLHKRSHFANQMESLTNKRTAIEGVLRRLNEGIEEGETRTGEIRRELESCELRHEELQSRKLDLLRSIDRESGNISLHEQRIADTQSRAENISEEMKRMRQKVEDLEESLRERHESLEKLRDDRSTCGERLKNRQEELDEAQSRLRKSESQSAELSGHLLDLIRRETEIQSRLFSAGERLGENDQMLSNLGRERNEILRVIKEKEKDLAAGRSEKEAVSAQLRQQKEKLSVFRTQLKETEENLHDVRKDILGAQGKAARVASERGFLAEALERYEGYDAGVRSVIEESKSEASGLRGIVGTVADVLEVSPGYESSIESALDDRVQWILTETVEDAKRAGNHLQEKRGGRATFLPLEAIGSPNGSRKLVEQLLKGNPGSVTPALDVVACDPQHKRAIELLLGNTLIVGEFDEALALLEGDHAGFTFVTSSGENVARGPAITVGRRATEALSLVNRKARIASLTQEEERIEKELGGLRQREEQLLESQRSLAGLVEAQMATISETSDRAIEVEGSLQGLSASVESFRKNTEDLTSRESQTASDQRRIEGQQKNLSQELESVSEKRTELDRSISSAKARVEGAQKNVASLKKDVAEISLAKASYDERIANLESDMEYMRGQLDLTQKELENRIGQIEQGRSYIENLQTEVRECHAAVASLKGEKEQVAEAIEKLDENRQVLVDELNQVEWETKEKRKAAGQQEKETADLNIKLTEVRFSVDGIDEKLMTDYGVSHEDPSLTPLPEKTDWEQVRIRIMDLKGKLQSMGPVNLFAIEEHDALRKRYDFLESQRSDVEGACESLEKAIARLDRESRSLFRDAFESIRTEFKKMFQRLFGGGRADLILVDESNILESGIEIIARPPGKKLQAISLLSGGERAMTAVSLLFAIFKVKPSPFCILDEIDAPLDDSNVVRFAEVLREFTENSQFVIITHNKRTISASDLLYGITMEESGKSRVVSARLTRRNEEVSAETAETSSELSEAEAVPAGATL
jgi:chromosome segregation protein